MKLWQQSLATALRGTAAGRSAKRILTRFSDVLNGHFGERTLVVDGLALTVDFADAGGRMYAQRAAHEESVSHLYKQIARELNPQLVIDIGANYGFTALIFARYFPHSRLVLVEPSPALCCFAERNLQQNHVSDYAVVQAICGEREEPCSRFSLNPHTSQDNRVVGLAGWKSIKVATCTLAGLVAEHGDRGAVFIKIDTQGFEERVFAGGAPFFEAQQSWLVKTEFAPHWLRSQGTDPLAFLRTLIQRYEVVECAARFRFERDELYTHFKRPLRDEEAAPFVAYVAGLDRDERGWCDLLLRSRRAGSGQTSG